MQPSNARGIAKPGTEPVEATATLVAGAELETIRQAVVAKYGFTTKITKVLGTLIGTLRGKRVPYGDRGVIVQLPEAG